MAWQDLDMDIKALYSITDGNLQHTSEGEYSWKKKKKKQLFSFHGTHGDQCEIEPPPPVHTSPGPNPGLKMIF